MANTFILTKSDGSVLTSINEGARDNRESTSLVLHGRGAADYGLQRDNNLVWMLENFASDGSPESPLVGQLWYKPTQDVFRYCSQGSPAQWNMVLNTSQVVSAARTLTAGAGLTGGGDLSADRTFDVGAGTGITVNANDIAVNPGGVNHNLLLNYVANEHVNHTSVTLTAGAGLTGGGDISASRSFAVGAGDGISVAADSVAVDTTVVRTSGAQTIAGVKQFTDQILGSGLFGSASAPSFSFAGVSQNTGMYLPASDTIGFSTDGNARLFIESDGTLSAQTASYEALVTSDNDIPNKKYVDDAITSGGSAPTSNTFSNNPHSQSGGYYISGLTIGKKYLVAVGGTTYGKGNGVATMQPIILFTGSTTLATGAVLDYTASYNIDWPDGQWHTSATFVVTATDADINCAVDFNGVTYKGADWMYAVQLD